MILPHSHEAESSLLSCFIQDPVNRIGEARNTLNVSAFHSEAHRRIFTALVAFYDAGKPIDVPLLTDHFRNLGELDAIGGPAYLTELFCFVPGPANYLQYKSVVDDKYLARRHIEAHSAALAAFQDSSLPIADAIAKAEEALDAVEKTITRKLGRITIKDAMKATMDEIEERMKRGGTLPGFPTGFPTIDTRCGGTQRGRVTVFAGLPSDGKSAIMQNVARHNLRAGARVAWYSLEMPNTEQTMRILCEDSGVDNASLYNGLMSRAQQEMLARSIRQLSELGCDLIDTDNATASDILADIEHGGYDVAVVDYLQLMEDEGRKGANREEIVSSVSRRMKKVAKRTGTHILTASQLNDFGKLRESRAIGQDADGVFIIGKVEAEGGGFDDTQRSLWCEKNRGGKRHWTIPLAFSGATFTFKEIQDEQN
jgi:replicative DNA helicase